MSGRTVTWSTSNPFIAVVSANGTVLALLPGRATLTATVDGVRGSATVEVEYDD